MNVSQLVLWKKKKSTYIHINLLKFCCYKWCIMHNKQVIIKYTMPFILNSMLPLIFIECFCWFLPNFLSIVNLCLQSTIKNSPDMNVGWHFIYFNKKCKIETMKTYVICQNFTHPSMMWATSLPNGLFSNAGRVFLQFFVLFGM